MHSVPSQPQQFFCCCCLFCFQIKGVVAGVNVYSYTMCSIVGGGCLDATDSTALLLNVDECCVFMWIHSIQIGTGSNFNLARQEQNKQTRVNANIEGSVSGLFTVFGSFMAMEPGLLLISLYVCIWNEEWR